MREKRYEIKIENQRKYKGSGVYVGRPSPLGNPFEIGRDGTREEDRAEVMVFTGKDRSSL
jgi:hypothetical protein